VGEKFLGSTQEIRRALVELLARAKSVDMAVAFVSSEWYDLFGQFRRRCRLICSLSSPATDPHAVEAMLRRGTFQVRQVDGMHAKVYAFRTRPSRIVVGSANLSGIALSAELSTRIEAAVLIDGGQTASAVMRWFSSEWRSARAIAPGDLAKAKVAYIAARRVGTVGRKGPRDRSSTLPADWTPSRRLKRLADDVRSITLAQLRRDWGGAVDFAPRTMSRSDLGRIVGLLSAWAKHPGAFAPAMKVSMSKVRAAFEVAFDNARARGDRLEALASAHKLPGLGLTAWTMILFWRAPAEYPPFNARTRKFLQDMKLGNNVPRTLTPTGYDRWCDLARQMAARLDLPSAGHVDRLVWGHTESMAYEEFA
jgi:hypothetical protein